MIECPCCGEMVLPEHFSCRSGHKGGKSGTGEAKARSSEQARKAALKRWALDRWRRKNSK